MSENRQRSNVEVICDCITSILVLAVLLPYLCIVAFVGLILVAFSGDSA